MSDKPNCYECRWRGEAAGSAHSSCRHPKCADDHNNPMGSLMAIFASVGRAPAQAGKAAEELDIKAHEHGIRMGWFNWPWDFDPTWLKGCTGFQEKEASG